MGKIKCPYCGYSCMHNRRVKNGQNEECWNCGSKKKKKTDTPCPVPGTMTEKALEKACCVVLVLDSFDEAAFTERVDPIEVPERSILQFFHEGWELRDPVSGRCGGLATHVPRNRKPI